MLGLGAYCTSVALSHFPGVADAAYGSFLGPALAWTLSLLTGWIPLAVGEILTVAFLLRLLVAATVAMRHVLRRERRLRNAVAGAALLVGQDAGILVAVFYLLWGFHYSRPPIEDRLGWNLPQQVSTEELYDLIRQLVLAANDEYRDIHGVDDSGAATILPDGRKPLETTLREGWTESRRELGLPAWSANGHVKTPLLTPLYEWVGVAGYYFPFTAEANLRAGIPAVDVPKMLAHEMAHQRGVARESEANFWGFLAAARAPDAYARYSAAVFAQRQLMIGLMLQDPQRVADLVRLRLPGVQRDIEDAREYWRSFRGTGTRIGTAMNNAYLRSNRVSGGVENYSRSALLFIAYARTRGGLLREN